MMQRELVDKAFDELSQAYERWNDFAATQGAAFYARYGTVDRGEDNSMPRILELCPFDGAMWAKLDVNFEHDAPPVSLYTNDEFETRKMKALERIAASLEDIAAWARKQT